MSKTPLTCQASGVHRSSLGLNSSWGKQTLNTRSGKSALKERKAVTVALSSRIPIQEKLLGKSL